MYRNNIANVPIPEADTAAIRSGCEKSKHSESRKSNANIYPIRQGQ